jgi:uncharacterized protein HemY
VLAAFLALVISAGYRPALRPRSYTLLGTVPSYSHAASIIGSVIMLVLCLAVLLALAIGLWRRRPRR